MLYVDIDELEAINEAFGLSAGDEVIQRVGTLLQSAVGADGLVSRLGRRPFCSRAAGAGQPRKEASSRRGFSPRSVSSVT